MSPKYVTELVSMEGLLQVCKYSKIPSKVWKVGVIFWEEIAEKIPKVIKKTSYGAFTLQFMTTHATFLSSVSHLHLS